MDAKLDFKALDRSDRKQRIVDTAARVFQQKGYRAATLDDVACELGLTKAALYHYVASKDELLSIIYLQALASFFAEAYEIRGLDLPPPEKLRRLVHRHIQHVILENLPMFSVFFSDHSQLPEKEFQEIRAEKVRYTRVVADLLQEGMAQGHFRPGDPWLGACALLGMCNWLYKWYRPGPRTPDPEALADHFLDLLERGYLREQGLATPGEDTARERRRALVQELEGHARGLADVARELGALV
ncbi:MAG: TetR/AcrR family transcriptional regulator [Deferrisomatales bacterium]